MDGLSRSTSAAGLDDNDGLPEPEYDHLDLSFEDAGSRGEDYDELGKPIKKEATTQSLYILGTLVVRVVAARDLEPVERGGFGQILLGGHRGTSTRSSRNSGGSANPYASVKFGDSTQRTSAAYETLDPTWPRSEMMYMDVALPVDEVTHAPISEQVRFGTTGSESFASLSSYDDDTPATNISQPILTVALFHASDAGANLKYPSKASVSGDSDDYFLGTASIDMTPLLTGKQSSFDEWLPLSGTELSRGTVRVVCEYEASDIPPRPGDVVRFTLFCHPTDLYPMSPGRSYKVEEVDGDEVLLSYTSPEGWICSFLAHRLMLFCEMRHQGAFELCQDEIASLTERLAYSPMVSVMTETIERLPEEGLFEVASGALTGGASLLSRWLEGGLGRAVEDVTHAANLDGRFNPDFLDSPNGFSEEHEAPIEGKQIDESTDSLAPLPEPLPNMPACPITGEPMRDPVVAADGHTYERSAIYRWLQTSDKSPLTGSVLVHKELVPNYVLLSSLQEASATTLRDTDID